MLGNCWRCHIGFALLPGFQKGQRLGTRWKSKEDFPPQEEVKEKTSKDPAFPEPQAA